MYLTVSLLISNKFCNGVTEPHWRGGMDPETSLRYLRYPFTTV
jgi:hypothetical protein